MESRELLSGLTPALNIRKSEFILPKGTDALHKVTAHDIRHVDARPGAVMSEARGQHSLGGTHANVIGAQVHSGSASSAVVPGQTQNFFQTTNTSFSVTGLNPANGIAAPFNVNYVGYWQDLSASPVTSQVKVTVIPLPNTVNGQVLDLWFQRTPVAPLGVKTRANEPALLKVGPIGKPDPIKLDLTLNQKVKVVYFVYFSIGDNMAVTNLDHNVYPFGKDTSMRVWKDPINGKKVFLVKEVENKSTSIIWPQISDRSFFELRNYADDLRKMGVANPNNTVNGIHFDILVTPA